MRSIVLGLVLLLVLPAAAAAKDVEVQLLGLNDFHGHLESTTPGTIAPDPTSPRVPAGGVEYLATHIRTKAAENDDTLIVSAGDLIGASPLLSALSTTSRRSRR
jgi:5'-nucleotidase